LAQPCGAELSSRRKMTANEADQRGLSPDVVVRDSACHAGGRGFESRRSRRSPCKSAYCDFLLSHEAQVLNLGQQTGSTPRHVECSQRIEKKIPAKRAVLWRIVRGPGNAPSRVVILRRDGTVKHRFPDSRRVEAGELEVAPFEVDDVGRRRDGDFVTAAARGPGGLAQTSRVRLAAGLA
jgi:hypothetical protein